MAKTSLKSVRKHARKSAPSRVRTKTKARKLRASRR